MPRILRWNTSESFHHVMNRGNERKQVFCDERDFLTFLKVLVDLQEDFGFQVFSYCLMPNHYHVLLRTPKANLSEGMRYLGFTYTKLFNRRHSRDGHLFRGRFHSVLVEGEAHLHTVVQYIHDNPVKAGLCRGERDYRWSSARQFYAQSKAREHGLRIDALHLEESVLGPRNIDLFESYAQIHADRHEWFCSTAQRLDRLRST